MAETQFEIKKQLVLVFYVFECIRTIAAFSFKKWSPIFIYPCHVKKKLGIQNTGNRISYAAYKE